MGPTDAAVRKAVPGLTIRSPFPKLSRRMDADPIPCLRISLRRPAAPSRSLVQRKAQAVFGRSFKENRWKYNFTVPYAK